MEVLLRLVDLDAAEVAARFEGDAEAAVAELLASGQVVRRPHLASPTAVGEEFVPAEYAGWFGAALAQAGSERTDLVRRFAANHGPFLASAIETRYGFAAGDELETLRADGLLAAGAFTPGGTGEEWCLVENLRQLHRQSLAILREQIEPREPAQFAAFLADWQGVSLQPQRSGVAALRKVLEQLQGVALPMEVWEPEVLHRRLATYQPAWLDQLCASGEIVWLGSTSPGGGKGKIAFYFRDEVELLQPAEGPPRSLSRNAERVRDWLRSRGASFLQDVAAGAQLGQPEVYDALWELVWAGEASNDTFDPVRSPRRPAAVKPPAPERQTLPGQRPRHWSYRRDFRRPGLPAGQGRWSLFVPGEPASAEDQAEAYARQLLNRYGVVAREMALAEDGPAPWAAVYQTLKRLEALGQVRRGYFVKGLSGAQFALPDAVERLRQPRDSQLLLNATDPANPYGAVLPFEPEQRVTRIATNALALVGGKLALAAEAQGRDLRPLSGDALTGLRLLPRLLDAPSRVRRLRKLEVETWAGQPAVTSDVRPLLAELGFEKEPQRLTLRPSRL